MYIYIAIDKATYIMRTICFKYVATYIHKLYDTESIQSVETFPNLMTLDQIIQLDKSPS